MSSSSGWEQPKELSAEDKISEYITTSAPRNSVALLVAMILVDIEFNPQIVKQDRTTYVELLRNLLDGLKHTAEMDCMGFMLEQITKIQEKLARHGKKLSIDDVLYMLAKAAEMARDASVENLNVAQNLTALYEEKRSAK